MNIAIYASTGLILELEIANIKYFSRISIDEITVYTKESKGIMNTDFRMVVILCREGEGRGWGGPRKQEGPVQRLSGTKVH